METTGKSDLKYVVLITEQDGTEMIFGAWSEDRAERSAANTREAFPDAHVRVKPLLSLTSLVRYHQLTPVAD